MQIISLYQWSAAGRQVKRHDMLFNLRRLIENIKRASQPLLNDVGIKGSSGNCYRTETSLVI